MTDSSWVILDGARPQSVSVSLAPGIADDATYGLGNTLWVAVEFNKNVTVRGSPVLVLDCGRMREALFYGGNDSTTLIFEYEVRLLRHETRLPTSPRHLLLLPVKRRQRCPAYNVSPPKIHIPP